MTPIYVIITVMLCYNSYHKNYEEQTAELQYSDYNKAQLRLAEESAGEHLPSMCSLTSVNFEDRSQDVAVVDQKDESVYEEDEKEKKIKELDKDKSTYVDRDHRSEYIRTIDDSNEN